MSSLLMPVYRWLGLERVEGTKIFGMGMAFFCIIAGYTILKEMKDALFVTLVGAPYLGKVKLISIFILIPATLLYAKMVDLLSKYALLTFYSFLYGFVGLGIAVALGFSQYGLGGSVTGVSNYLGWFIYLFYEGFTPFVLSLYWSFLSSIMSPDEARRGYTLITVFTKMGGILTAALGWVVFTHGVVWMGNTHAVTVSLYQFLFGIASAFLCAAPLVLFILQRKMSAQDLVGYKATHASDQDEKKQKVGMFAGLELMLKTPYILAIFGMTFFYESMNVALSFQRLVVLQEASTTGADFIGGLFLQRLGMHLGGLFVVFLGTRTLIHYFGERFCLLLVPFVSGSIIAAVLITNSPTIIAIAFVVLSSLNYAFTSPLKEALYIPTSKDIRFKSKSWIDSFGTKISKGFASGFIHVLGRYVPGSVMYTMLTTSFYSVVVILWTGVAWYVGKKYQDVVKKNKVIGIDAN